MTTARNAIALFFLHAGAVSALTLLSNSASAQATPTAPPHVPLQKAIGTPVKPELAPSLFVLSARGATLQGGKLVLSGLSPNSIVFADRPVRSAGHELTAHILEEWLPGNQSPDSFYKDPPNATVSAFMRDGSGIRDAVVVLKSPKLEGDQVTFDVDVMEGDLAGGDGAASIFIDLIGRPFTPLSFAGVARRTAFRGAYYRGAAIAGAGALGAAAYYAPYAYRPVCGYYPYPPCY
ncbi:hypothetical protein AB4Z10_13265 [Bosea sp. RAF48]|uniref:hypothetical protein n=1 Tax=Bosea sp. RAF48 TaxID=3237480 RepID=UPI003F8DD19F